MAADVLQVITSTDRRGAEVSAVELGRALGRRGRAVRTVALAPGDAGGALEVPTLGSSALGPRALRSLRAETRAARLVIAHGSKTLPACAIATFGSGVPFVYRNIGDPAYWGRDPLRRFRSAMFLRRARAVVALTPATARQLTARFRVAPAKLRVIANAVDADAFPVVDRDRRHEARAQFGLPREGQVAVYLGALTPEKQVDLAIGAVAALPGVHLLIAGDGPERAALEATAAEQALGRVHFVGATDDSARVLSAGDIVVLPSRTEGLPVTLIEAGMSGLPVVATDVGFVQEIVVDRETGFLVPSGDLAALVDGIAKALEDPSGVGQAARARCIAHFELRRVAQAWDELITELSDR